MLRLDTNASQRCPGSPSSPEGPCRFGLTFRQFLWSDCGNDLPCGIPHDVTKVFVYLCSPGKYDNCTLARHRRLLSRPCRKLTQISTGNHQIVILPSMRGQRWRCAEDVGILGAESGSVPEIRRSGEGGALWRRSSTH